MFVVNGLIKNHSYKYRFLFRDIQNSNTEYSHPSPNRRILLFCSVRANRDFSRSFAAHCPSNSEATLTYDEVCLDGLARIVISQMFC